MQRMKQLARSAVYWPRTDTDIEDIARHCAACNEHQRLPPEQPSHPWITPEKPWSRIHIDHAINFRGHNWLVMVDAFSKYPSIHINEGYYPQIG
ncbi:transposon tf2-9 polyprotein [Plakobranchus ocellatus]|uniref:Transposon tf2-9 polyprotein n=1 Tax=Plakobranchus ocellatus TaxID=259542 RepID=A0AAV3YI84_9GAST|nr:transposon tf2-9 polyprotein [Plakobranchus ocellatus]